MVQYGADLVLASHPHVIQPVEFMDVTELDGTKRTAFIAYSMGNFISSQRTEPRDAGIIFHFTFEKSGARAIIKEVSFTPTWVKFINKSGSYDITVLPAADALSAINGGEARDLRASDVTRLSNVLKETTKKILKTHTTEIKDRYILEQNKYNTAKMYFIKKQ
jgi:poly-gamma-glutamate synthesis protein (capsule biosynthesis protein)